MLSALVFGLGYVTALYKLSLLLLLLLMYNWGIALYFMTFYDLLQPVLIENVSMSRWSADIKLDSCQQFIFNAGITFFFSIPGLQEAIHVVASNFRLCLNVANDC